MRRSCTYQGDPCARCGATERYTRNNICASCNRARATKHRIENPGSVKAYLKEYYDHNSDRLITHRAEYRRNNQPALLAYAESERGRDAAAAARATNAAAVYGAPGKFNGAQWRTVRYAHNNRCVSCSSDEPLTVDHVIPLSRGGTNYISNIQPLCMSCNCKKHCDSTDYRSGRP